MKAMQAYDQTTQLKLKSRDAIIHFDEGLIGFSEFKDFVLMENDSLEPFRLLQSLESPEVGFLVLEAAGLVKNYYDLAWHQRQDEAPRVCDRGRGFHPGNKHGKLPGSAARELRPDGWQTDHSHGFGLLGQATASVAAVCNR